MEVRGKVFLVTGAGSGLGAATVRQLARAGARLALADVDGAAGEALAAELGTNVFVVRTGSTRPSSSTSFPMKC